MLKCQRDFGGGSSAVSGRSDVDLELASTWHPTGILKSRHVFTGKPTIRVKSLPKRESSQSEGRRQQVPSHERMEGPQSFER